MYGTKRELLERINALPDSEEPIVMQLWFKEDVQEANEGARPLEDLECHDVLYLLDNNHDANVGITNEVITDTISSYMGNGYE